MRAIWTICLAGVFCGLISGLAHGDPTKTGGKGVKIPFSNYLDGDVLTITTTGTASGKNPPPTINTHTVQVMANTIKNGSFTVPAQDKNSDGKLVNVRDYDISVDHEGPDGYKSNMDVESLDPTGSSLDQNSVSDELSQLLGDGNSLRLPLFTADDGASLYVSANIDVYIPADVPFNIGEQFTIASDGTSPALRGLHFGTSEISLDPSSSTGFDNSNAFSGDVTVVAENDPSAVAVPVPMGALGGIALMIGIAAARVHRGKLNTFGNIGWNER